MRYCCLVFAALAILSPSWAATIYTDRVSFNAAAGGGLVVEDLEGGNLAAGSVFGMGPILDAATNNSVYASGSILPGLRIEGVNGLDISYGQLSDNPSFAIFVQNRQETMTIRFLNGGASAAGLDFYSLFSEGPTSPVTVYDVQGNLLATQDLDLLSAGRFFGMSSGIPIGSLQFTLLNTGGTFGVDDIAFSAASEVPEPVTLVTVGVVVGLGSLGIVRRRKR